MLEQHLINKANDAFKHNVKHIFKSFLAAGTLMDLKIHEFIGFTA